MSSFLQRGLFYILEKSKQKILMFIFSLLLYHLVVRAEILVGTLLFVYMALQTNGVCSRFELLQTTVTEKLALQMRVLMYTKIMYF